MSVDRHKEVSIYFVPGGDIDDKKYGKDALGDY